VKRTGTQKRPEYCPKTPSYSALKPLSVPHPSRATFFVVEKMGGI
jgi:hypothetical protein